MLIMLSYLHLDPSLCASNAARLDIDQKPEIRGVGSPWEHCYFTQTDEIQLPIWITRTDFKHTFSARRMNCLNYLP